MEEFLGQGLTWWVTIIELPALTALLYMVLRTRKEFDLAIRHVHEALSDFQIEVAKSYASSNDLKDLESRIVNHLLRIESKLDRTALKTEALKAKKE